jgi:hypothetical protein
MKVTLCQVVLGLEVLGHILGRLWRGELDGCFEQNLVGGEKCLVIIVLLHIFIELWCVCSVCPGQSP